MTPLPFDAGLERYQRQAEQLLEDWNAGDASAVQTIRRTHPRFLNPDIPWLPKNLTDEEVRRTAFDLADARLSVARWYDFENWPRLVEYVSAVTQTASPVFHFESAVEAVI